MDCRSGGRWLAWVWGGGGGAFLLWEGCLVALSGWWVWYDTPTGRGPLNHTKTGWCVCPIVVCGMGPHIHVNVIPYRDA